MRPCETRSARGRRTYHTQRAKMSFDKNPRSHSRIFYFYFVSIALAHHRLTRGPLLYTNGPCMYVYLYTSYTFLLFSTPVELSRSVFSPSATLTVESSFPILELFYADLRTEILLSVSIVRLYLFFSLFLLLYLLCRRASTKLRTAPAYMYFFSCTTDLSVFLEIAH